MLDTSTLSGSKTITGSEITLAQIPEDVKQSAQQAVESSSTPGVSVPGVRVSSCCGYYSSGNPFPCCVAGNCTWWVFYKYGWVPFRHDAWKWWGQVPDYYLWRRGGGPGRKEDIAWWNKSPSSSLGHVAYVANYTGGGTIHTSEMACGSDKCAYTRDRSVSAPDGYIYERYSPQP
ncbi:MAG: CHAP domain-containing protein [Anaerolineae bacterium]